jgi:hypothetical protein
MSFRFKELPEAVGLCHHKTSENVGEYLLVISLKNLPKIEVKHSTPGSDRYRCSSLEPRHINDRCTICIDIFSATIETLLGNTGLVQLNKFGVLSGTF